MASFCLQIILPITLFVVSGCTTLNNREPEWVRNPKSVYPDSNYLVAVGEGDTRRSAENAAAANLSRIFEAHIESDERVVDKVSESMDAFIRTTDLTTDINILSSQTLMNIQHAEAWMDDTGRYHAVAYLDRRDTAAIYRDRINEGTDRIQSLLGYASESDSKPLKQYALLRTAARAAAGNDLLLRQLKVIHPPSASAVTPPYSIIDLQNAAIESAKGILVSIEIEGDGDGRMNAILQELITQYGFVVGRPPTLQITGDLSITDTGQRTAGLAFFRYHLTIHVSDAQGNVLLTMNEKGREAVTSPDEAQTRCYRTLEHAIRTHGGKKFDAYFDALASLAE